jgi:hypothetical protein
MFSTAFRMPFREDIRKFSATDFHQLLISNSEGNSRPDRSGKGRKESGIRNQLTGGWFLVAEAIPLELRHRSHPATSNQRDAPCGKAAIRVSEPKSDHHL